MKEELQHILSASIAEAIGGPFRITECKTLSGGCINEAWFVGNGPEKYFVKLNAASRLDMFEAEAAALKELAASKTIRAPQPITHGLAGDRSYLVLEALSMGSAKAGSWETMGQQLAQLHRTTTDRFGWHYDNVIGSTPQPNKWTDDWPTFFREQRLRHQFKLANRNGTHFPRADELLGQIENLLRDHSPAPSLLHGDLWSGDGGFLDDGTPVIYDPATYYGDRETDLAFSEFFGGFPGSFYQAYEKEWPLEPGYEKRKLLYNLYHVLNHANLFGGGYAGQAEGMIGQLLK